MGHMHHLYLQNPRDTQHKKSDLWLKSGLTRIVCRRHLYRLGRMYKTHTQSDRQTAAYRQDNGCMFPRHHSALVGTAGSS